MDDQNKNLILATALSFVVILVWFLLFPPPEQSPGITDADGEITAPESAPESARATASDDETAAPSVADTPAQGTGQALGQTVDAALAEAERVEIATPRLTGSISLKGGRIDDLSLSDYREDLAEDSDLVRLLSPVGSADPYYALHGWIATVGVERGQVPGPDTIWSVESGSTLAPGDPVTLAWSNDAGLTFRKTISVDEDYMFTIRQSVENASEADVAMRPYGLVARHGEPETIGFFILHEGVVRMSDGTLEETSYGKMPDLTADESRVEVAENGWVGFTDKYWMTTLIPEPGTEFRSVARAAGVDDDNPESGVFQTETIYAQQTVAAGETLSAETQLFAGAKEWGTIRDYEQAGIEGFIDSIDWGWFFFLTKPIFAVLHWLNELIGNMGWSIIGLTLLIKAVLFPLAFKSYVSMAKMRELQPEMEKLKERAGDNREEMQKGMMELYKTNKVNPASGCLPILLQIPIFFSLYKVIFVTIELRHAPWFGWIKDLSAPDPSSILNLFGLLPWSTPEPGSIFFIFSLGILPILLGISMYLQQKLNPAPTDPTQKMIFAWMPWVFMFMLGGFASGLVLYWISNNVITFLQQYTIMRSQGYKPDLVGNIIGSFRKKGDGASKEK
ncbi:MAG: membrane protein insertase YidC [Salibaculum sp.]|uniref:membrane protein insertase YidC n=1 Tax=Salibaculum sp. TaxID=2855480 RepID=UPI002870103A|nr:membrane protein insertase YidC [Salibaculum sp.]MDR9428079.1 membrane protein insertase YidC [Salibaculum sp.]